MSAVLAPAPVPSDGLRHVGVLYEDRDDLVETVLPHLDQALRSGDAVATMVDRRTARGLRDGLGDRADALVFSSPNDLAHPRPENFLRRLRALARSGGRSARRALVLSQYSAFSLTDDELAVGESGINLVLGDQPMTVLCACSQGADPFHVDAMRHSHPWWLDAAGTQDNPAYRVPADHSPIPSTMWGGVHALALRFGRTADLARVRRQVGTLAHEAGLRGDGARAAVLAVHETAVVACDEVEDASLSPASEPCAIDAWRVGSQLVVEVRGPRAAGAQLPAADGRLPRNRVRMAGPLRVVRAICPEVSAVETAQERTVRIVVGA